MKVLVTGATGYIGYNVVKLLVKEKQKYDVIGLCRNEEGAQKLRDIGVNPLIGDVREPEKIAETAKKVDAVLHLAWIRDWKDMHAIVQYDVKFIEAILKALEGTRRCDFGLFMSLQYFRNQQAIHYHICNCSGRRYF